MFSNIYTVVKFTYSLPPTASRRSLQVIAAGGVFNANALLNHVDFSHRNNSCAQLNEIDAVAEFSYNFVFALSSFQPGVW